VELDGSSKVDRWRDQSGKSNHAVAKNGAGTALATTERPAPASGGVAPMTASQVISFDGGDYLTVPGNAGLTDLSKKTSYVTVTV
jgi:hypothetical protein